MPLTVRTQHFINNEWVDSQDAEKAIDTINPATEEKLASVQSAGQKDVDAAVAAAKAAFYGGWRDTPGKERRALLLKLADLMEANLQELAEWESKDNGKPVSTARDIDIPFAIEHLR